MLGRPPAAGPASRSVEDPMWAGAGCAAQRTNVRVEAFYKFLWVNYLTYSLSHVIPTRSRGLRIVISLKNLAKLPKFAAVYSIALSVIWLFDYGLMIWLARTFGYLMVFPLCPALFLACWGGLYLYDFFNEDVFFIEAIQRYLHKNGSFPTYNRIKSSIRTSRRMTFILISIWWSPLHAYLFFRQHGDTSKTAIKSIAIGSLYCAVFWGILVDLLLLIWNILKPVFIIA